MSYEARQYGVWVIVPLFIVLMVVVALLVFEGQLLGGFTAAAVLFALILNFSYLTVRVGADALQLSFGVGLIKRTIPLNRIASTAKVRNKWWYGLGIRLTPHGWMWNVGGLDAVELTYQDGRCFRVGTAEPDRLKAALDAKLQGPQA